MAGLGDHPLVRVLFNVQQVIGHGLKCELVQERCHGVGCPVHDQQLGPGFLRTLETGDR